MKRVFIVLFALTCCGQVFADDNTDNSSSSNSTSNSDGSTTSTNQSNQQLLQEMNKKTSKGLKVFDKLLQDNDQAKQDFFADVGKNPTAAQFEGGGGDGGSVENPFAKILGSDAQSNQ